MAVERVELFPSGVLGVADPARLGAFGAMVVTALFTLLYVYRRRAYILQWVSAWVLLTGALSVAARDTQQATVALLMLGFSRFLSLTAILAIASSPLTFRNRRWLDRPGGADPRGPRLLPSPVPAPPGCAQGGAAVTAKHDPPGLQRRHPDAE